MCAEKTFRCETRTAVNDSEMVQLGLEDLFFISSSQLLTFFEVNEPLVKNIPRRNITTPVYIECDIMYQ